MLLCALRVSRLAALLVAAVLLAPCFIAQGVSLYKDFLMAELLGLGAAAASLQQQPQASASRRWLLPVALAATLTGALIRVNAVFAAAPVLISLCRPEWPFRRLRLLLLSGLLSLALIPAAAVINEAAFHPMKMSVLELAADLRLCRHHPLLWRQRFPRRSETVLYRGGERDLLLAHLVGSVHRLAGLLQGARSEPRKTSASPMS